VVGAGNSSDTGNNSSFHQLKDNSSISQRNPNSSLAIDWEITIHLISQIKSKNSSVHKSARTLQSANKKATFFQSTKWQHLLN